MRPHLIRTALAGILLMGLTLRVMNVGAIRPTNSDEASYLRQGRFMVALVQYVRAGDAARHSADGSRGALLEGGEEGKGVWQHARKDDWSAKPCWLHSGFIALGMVLMGVGDGAGAAVSIVFSLAAVVLCFLIGRRLSGAAVGLVGALFLSVSCFWLLYSRGMLAEVDSVCLALLGFYSLFALTADHRGFLVRAFAGGVVTAMAVLCHYRLLYVIAPLGGVLLLLAPPRKWVSGGVVLVAGFAGTLGLVALVLRFAVAAAGPDVPFTGLIGALLERYVPQDGGVEQTGVQFSNMAAVLFYLSRNHGWVMSGLAVVGVGVGALNVLYERRFGALLALGLFSLLVLCFQVWVVARASSLLIPIFCIYAGLGAVTVWRVGDALVPNRRRAVQVVAVILIGMALIENVVKDLRLVRNQVGFCGATQTIRDLAPGTVLADPESAILYGWYAPELPFESYRKYCRDEGMTLPTNAVAVFDAQKYHMYPAARDSVTQFEARVGQAGRRVATIPHLTTAWKEFLYDGTQAHSLGGMLESIRSADPADITTIRVYRVE